MHVHPPRKLLGFDNIDLHDGYLHFYRNGNVPYQLHQCVHDDYIHDLKIALGADADVVDTGIDCNSWLARPWLYDEKLHPTTWATDRAIDFLRRPTVKSSFSSPFQRPSASALDARKISRHVRPGQARAAEYGDWEDVHGSMGRHIIAPTPPKNRRQLALTRQVITPHDAYRLSGRTLMDALFAKTSAATRLWYSQSDHGEMLATILLRKSCRMKVRRAFRSSFPAATGATGAVRAPMKPSSCATYAHVSPPPESPSRCCDGVDLFTDAPENADTSTAAYQRLAVQSHIVTDRDNTSGFRNRAGSSTSTCSRLHAGRLAHSEELSDGVGDENTLTARRIERLLIMSCRSARRALSTAAGSSRPPQSANLQHPRT